MLRGIEIVIFDIQDIGIRPYTYISSLFYMMEEAAKYGIEIIVLDRPNPMGGIIVDGPMLDKNWRSFIGYVNVPYCHGMTVGELAQFFNAEYAIHAKLRVIPLQGWKRDMDFFHTGLIWIPTSPYVPEADTPFYMATTGLLGELELVNIGIGYTLPFKCVGAPWIDADTFAAKLNEQRCAGVHFLPFHYRPFYGLYKEEECHGVLIRILDPTCYRPSTTQYLIMGILKSLYPKEVERRLTHQNSGKKQLFCKANGNAEAWRLLREEKYIAWKLVALDKEERKHFLEIRKKYLLYPIESA